MRLLIFLKLCFAICSRTNYYTCPDDETFRFLASTYSQSHHNMSLSMEFPGGITNGASWYDGIEEIPWSERICVFKFNVKKYIVRCGPLQRHHLCSRKIFYWCPTINFYDSSQSHYISVPSLMITDYLSSALKTGEALKFHLDPIKSHLIISKIQMYQLSLCCSSGTLYMVVCKIGTMYMQAVLNWPWRLVTINGLTLWRLGHDFSLCRCFLLFSETC